jgi:hypothetical protein
MIDDVRNAVKAPSVSPEEAVPISAPTALAQEGTTA